MAGEDREIEWLPPGPDAPGEMPPRFDPQAPDPLPPPPPPPAYTTAPPPTGPPVHPPPGQPPVQSPGGPHGPSPPSGPHGPPPPSGPHDPPPPPAWQQTPSAPWPYAYGKAPGNNQAIWSLVTGIAGLVLFIFPAGFGLVFLFNLPASIAAWVLGVHGRRRVDQGKSHEHRGKAQAGLVLGVVGVVIGVLAIVGWALAIALSEDVRDELRRSIEDSRNS